MKSYLKRKWQRGLTLIEMLVVMVIGAGIIAVVAGLVVDAIDDAEVVRTEFALGTVLPKATNWLQRTHYTDCNGGGTTGGDNYRLLINEALTEAQFRAAQETAAGSATVWSIDATPALAVNANCRRMWNGLRGFVNHNGADSVVLGSATDGFRTAIEINVATGNDSATNVAAFVGDSAATPTGFSCAVGTRLALAISVSNLDVCEGVLDYTGRMDSVTTSQCHEYSAANTIAVTGDAALLMCMA